MIHFLRRVLLLLLVFVIGVAGTALLLNSETTDDRSDMNDPTLPEVMVQYSGNYANRMYGYREKMQTDFMRDSVTPMDTSKSLTFVVNPYSTKVNSLSYEIRTSDGSKVIENRKVKNLKKNDDYLTASVKIESDLRMSQEYSMQIELDTSKGKAYYYTRVISRSKLNTGEYVKFVKSFYEKCMDKTTADDLSSYLEPTTTGNATNFANITINSSLSEVSWGQLKPQMIKKGVPVINDINETTASISIEYQISAKDENGYTQLFDVTDFYRMRYTETRIMLLDFTRSAREIFDPESHVITENGLVLGIRNRDVNYMLNDDVSIVAFEQQGDLWTYRPSDGKIVRIFSFRRDEGSDFRDSRNEHNIKIIRVGENGDVDFVLAGYMNRGIHEGYCGICVYHYNSDQNVLEEKVFIPGTESFEFLKKDLGTLSYVNEQNQLFLLFAQKLYQVNIDEGTFKVLDEDVEEGFVVSDTNAHAAWILTGEEDTGKIKMVEFDTGKDRVLDKDADDSCTTIGFMNEDLVYGLTGKEDILEDKNGRITEGMHSIRIEAFDGEVKKDYHKDDLYAMNAEIKGTLMEFDMAEKADSGYKFVRKDNIMNNRRASANQIAVESTSASRVGIMVRLAFSEKPETEQALVVYSKLKSVDERDIALDTTVPRNEVYYVYAKGGLDCILADPAEAVRRADEQMGVVLNRGQQYVWERGNKKTQYTLNVEDVPRVFCSGAWNLKELQEGIGEEGVVIDLTGCTLDQVLYEISAQRPVIAKTSADSAIVLIGYDEYNTWWYDPVKGEITPYGMNDSTELFEKAGNVFISYIETVNYQ
ncbi:MAG: hypothetical protein IJX90_10925 [Blautia sp.]|nr:hypothetical protein [Blautia sp.]